LQSLRPLFCPLPFSQLPLSAVTSQNHFAYMFCPLNVSVLFPNSVFSQPRVPFSLKDLSPSLVHFHRSWRQHLKPGPYLTLLPSFLCLAPY
jgi:hypothetical protein